DSVVSLAIFDIDGTLIDSNAVDNECFLASLGTSAGATDWSDYPHHTDRGLTHEFLRWKWSRDPVESEITRHRTAFIDALRARITSLEGIRGARAFLEFLRERGWEIALATGAWSESAAMKLNAAGFPSTLPLACCDEWLSREEIVLGAIAGRKYDRIVVSATAGGMCAPCAISICPSSAWAGRPRERRRPRIAPCYHFEVLPVASNEREFEVPGFVGECISCGPQALRGAVARYAYGTYAGFFGLLKRVEIYGTCTKCENEVLIPEAEVPHSVRDQIPFMHRKKTSD